MCGQIVHDCLCLLQRNGLSINMLITHRKDAHFLSPLLITGDTAQGNHDKTTLMVEKTTIKCPVLLI